MSKLEWVNSQSVLNFYSLHFSKTFAENVTKILFMVYFACILSRTENADKFLYSCADIQMAWILK